MLMALCAWSFQERRLQEQERDEAAIRKRLDAARLSLQQERDVKPQRPLGTPLSFSSPAPKAALTVTKKSVDSTTASPPDARLPGIYARIEDLSADALRTIAEQQALRDMAPLNTRGKYHARFMRDRYPIAGSQFKIEKERDLCVAAKKKLLLENSLSSAGVGGAGSERTASMRRSLSLGTEFGSAYRKLDFYVDKMSDVLRVEELDVHQARRERQVRLIEARHEEGLQQFWTLFHSAHKRCVRLRGG